MNYLTRITSSPKQVLAFVVFLTLLIAAFSIQAKDANPRLVSTQADIAKMRLAIKTPGSFKTKFEQQKRSVDKQMEQAITVPVPADGGGGYTHERHKKNYKLMYEAGMLFQLTQDKKYAELVRDMLLQYADLYPTLDVHPKRKAGANNPGKLFWQSLNEAVWLVYSIQAYDFVLPALKEKEITKIEQGIFRPIVKFLSVDSPATFNKVHNHGTWLTSGVGMAGYVLNEPEWVEQALYDLDKSGKGGFLKQLDELFSPQGYYNEGPYYQRYALLPFITFAKAIESNEPERKIFEYRDGIVLKAITTTIQLSYNGLFFPINDAIKSKGIDTIELVNGVTIAYGLTGDTGLLEIAQIQDQIILTGDGLKVAQALDAGKATPYEFESVAFGDGADGTQGALVIMRQSSSNKATETDTQAVLFKPAAQGLGHGHFDKLTWQFYDKGAEIVSDYGAARFLNVEAKYGGRYLPENDTYAKQTVSHNTVVVDESSHFNANVKKGNANHPKHLFFVNDKNVKLSSATIYSAYEGVELTRTLALINLPEQDQTLVIDVFDVNSKKAHQFDLPVHYQGQFIDSNFALNANDKTMSALGDKNGYQHLWLKAQATPKAGLARVTWLHDNGRFYTQSSIETGNSQILFTQIGANDPNFNLRNENAFIHRVKDTKKHSFVSILEPHGEYNPSKEFTISATSKVSGLAHVDDDNVTAVLISFLDGKQWVLAYNKQSVTKAKRSEFSLKGKKYTFSGQYLLQKITK
ncbi:heparinase II/III family protein [uncultured Psychrosphaera sp.]|uniref:heparinase II/III domain-containing protein n=1 Tax=uncultured Psychrosphaera sp. TaxID=1403522 RepID=UPI0026112D39|nr:heparinase II/III family protein [uncultured Psychrosphaera sp.]